MFRRKKGYRVYGDVLKEFRPTIKSLIFNILYAKFLELKRTKESPYDENRGFQLPQEYLPHSNLEYLAIVSNGVVKEMIRLDKGTAEIITKKGIKFIPFNPQEVVVKIGTKFDGKDFVDENKEN